MRRPLTTVVVVGILAAGCATTTSESSFDTATAGQSAPVRTETTAPEAPSGETGRLVRAFDGDSMEVDVDGDIVEVRLLGINAPESDECHGDAARTLLLESIGDDDLILITGDEDRDQFGRLLRYVWAGGVDVNARVLTLGAAVSVQSGHPREAEYGDLALDAMRSQRGMWALDACGEPLESDVTVDVPNYDPPGRDFENSLQEWVDIRNDGTTDVDLDGWTLRDESTQHRYVFDRVVLPAGERVRIRSGCGDDRGLDLTWCAGDAVWNNGGDTAILQDAHGNVVAWSRYQGDF